MIKFQDNFNETHIMIYIDWSKNGLLILLFQDNNGIYSLVMTLKAYNSNNRKKPGPQFVTTFNLMLSNHGTFFMPNQEDQSLLLKANFNCLLASSHTKNPCSEFQGFRKSCEKTFACFCQSIGGMGIIIMFFQLSTILFKEKL